MPASEVRQELRRRRLELRALLPRFREIARERFARIRELPALKTARERLERRRRRQRIAAGIAIALLLLLLIDCEGPAGRGAKLAKAVPSPSPKMLVPKPTPQKPLVAKLEPQKRPGYTLDARPGPDWLDDFRLQVAARSPRLSSCFNGSERGGVLRWTVSVDAKSGAVSGHEFEPLGNSAHLRTEQKACVTKALSDPAYLIKDPASEALPNRVSLVLEF